MVLDLGDLWSVPKTVDDLTDRTERLAMQVRLRHRSGLDITAAPTDLSGVSDDALRAGADAAELYSRTRGPVYRSDICEVAIEYVGGPYARNSRPKTVRLSIKNNRVVPVNAALRWYMPDGWRVLPSQTGSVFLTVGWAATRHDMEFELICDKFEGESARFVVELTIDGRPTAMLVPVILLNGNLVPGVPAP